MKPGDRVTLQQLEIEHIRLVLENADGIGDAAEWLGIDRGTLRKKIEKLRINYMKYACRPPPETNASPHFHPLNSASQPDDAETSTDD